MKRFWWFPIDLWRYRRYRRGVILIQMSMKFDDPVSFKTWRGCYLNPRHPDYLKAEPAFLDTEWGGDNER